MVNIKKESNFNLLDNIEKKQLDEQLNMMISHKYKFINYNGLRIDNLKKLSNNFKINPFDNKTIIIDEAHNLVSRIVNKLNNKDSVSYKLYEFLIKAEKCKIVLLSGTPVINYPNELAVLYNILRGNIKTFNIKLNVKSNDKLSLDYFKELFGYRKRGSNIIDFMEYNSRNTMLMITRNPFGYINKTKNTKYDGIKLTSSSNNEIDDETFIELINKLLKVKNIKISNVNIETFKCLPDKLDDFKALFIDNMNNIKNSNLFKRRIIGLTSYFKSAQEQLMPKYDNQTDFIIHKIPMSDFQFSSYEIERVKERKLEKLSKKRKKKSSKDVFEETSVSTYRIFSRAYCNYVFPKPMIIRPFPKNIEETEVLNIVGEESDPSIENMIDENNNTNYDKKAIMKNYEKDIKIALNMLDENKLTYLSKDALKTYSPKFLKMINSITSPSNVGLNLIYSQFRTLEGIGILKLAFEANGYAQFKIKKINNLWQLDILPDDMVKPKYALYTGTESSEEKEIIRNVFNTNWDFIPISLSNQIKVINSNNFYGEIVKVLMISASGAEGISLKNVRYVHITEPYWHPVRIEQVIGRARRICSHQDLPIELRNIKVYLYLMTLSEKQLLSDESIEMRIHDKSKLDVSKTITSDEYLYEISNIKENIIKGLLKNVKEASFDCSLHNNNENLQCFSFPNINIDNTKFSYNSSVNTEQRDSIADVNKSKVSMTAKILTIKNVKYAYDTNTNAVYDIESYKTGQPIQIGYIIVKNKPNGDEYKVFSKI